MFEKPKRILREYVRKNNIKCCYCGRKYTYKNKMSIDHLLPKIKGGTYDTNNIVVACVNCNSQKKQNMTIEEFLVVFPIAIKHLENYIERMGKLYVHNKRYVDEISWIKQYFRK